MLRRTFLALTASTAMASSAFAAGHTMDIVDTAVEAGSFTTLVAAVEAAGLVETLKGEGPFTVFAPTDDAFAALPEGTVEGLLEDPEALASILTYHVVPGAVMSGDLSDGMMADHRERRRRDDRHDGRCDGQRRQRRHRRHRSVQRRDPRHRRRHPAADVRRPPAVRPCRAATLTDYDSRHDLSRKFDDEFAVLRHVSATNLRPHCAGLSNAAGPSGPMGPSVRWGPVRCDPRNTDTIPTSY